MLLPSWLTALILSSVPRTMRWTHRADVVTSPAFFNVPMTTLAPLEVGW